MRGWARAVRAGEGQAGNASVEFIGWSLSLVIPVLYLLVTLAQIQAASFAVVSAADTASRVLELDHSGQALARAHTAVELALADQGIEADATTAMTLTCVDGCARTAVLRVEVGVDLPGLAAIGLGRDVVVLDAQRAVDLSEREEQ